MGINKVNKFKKHVLREHVARASNMAKNMEYHFGFGYDKKSNRGQIFLTLLEVTKTVLNARLPRKKKIDYTLGRRDLIYNKAIKDCRLYIVKLKYENKELREIIKALKALKKVDCFFVKANKIKAKNIKLKKLGKIAEKMLKFK